MADPHIIEQGRMWNIPLSRPFADDLAAGLLQQFSDPLQLARVLLLLPTRRSIRAVTDAFLRESEGAALLLPRMVAAGDLDLEEGDALTGGPLFDQLSGEAEARPVITPLARRLALAKLLAGSRSAGAAEALGLADQLARALDVLEIEGRSAAEIEAAVPEGLLQQHWLQNAAVLQLVMEFWPGILQDRGLIDASRRRNLQLDDLVRRWQQAPPANPVIMAGFAAAPPAVARLARTIRQLPQGMLIMPGLDTQLSDDALTLLRPTDERLGLETHPQFGMVQLLDAAGISIREVMPWPAQSARKGSPVLRERRVADALCPAELSAQKPLQPAEADHNGIVMLEADSPAEEALAIAIAMRQIVEHRDRTAALVTPDRALARRVRVQLKRFAIDIDDSAGEALAATGPGSLLQALATAAGDGFAPVALLGALQHPLVRSGPDRLHWLQYVRELDLKALRGVRPVAGLNGVARRIAQSKHSEELLHWWQDEAMPLLQPLDPAPRNAADLLSALRQVAEWLAGDALWAGVAGQMLARLFEEVEDAEEDLRALALKPEEASAFVAALMDGQTVRPHSSRHPQLHIWGPLEARLQHADVLILGGLNEATWPGQPAPDPFLAPSIRRALRLPGLERRIGLQAHDFAAGMGAPEVLLTRSIRAGGAPTIASRFWQRLQAMLGSLPDAGHLLPSRLALLEVARAMERPAPLPPHPRPVPAPPAEARPKRITVTDVAMLKADPFSFYAKRILQLRPLEARDAEPTAGERGQIVHDILDKLQKEGWPGEPRIQQLIDAELAQFGAQPVIAALWRPRVERMVDWVLQALQADPDWTPDISEKRAEAEIDGVTLIGRIDRLDKSAHGLRVADYKTGAIPRAKQVASLYQTQLALLAMLAEAGFFGDYGNLSVTDLEYWRLSGGREPGEIKPALGKTKKDEDDPVAAHIEAAQTDFRQLIARFLRGDEAFDAKLHMVLGRNFRDYDHLARVAEWLGQ